MATWITEEGVLEGPLLDIDPLGWVAVPEKDGTWRTIRGPRFNLPVIRYEGTPEEIAREVRVVRDTCPYRASYDPPPFEEPVVSAHLKYGNWFKTEDPTRFVLFFGFYVAPQTDIPQKHVPIDFAVLEYHAKRVGDLKERPLPLESEFWLGLRDRREARMRQAIQRLTDKRTDDGKQDQGSGDAEA